MRLFLLWLWMGLLSWHPLVWILYTQVRRSLGRKWPKQSRETKCCTHLVPTSDLVVRSSWSPTLVTFSRFRALCGNQFVTFWSLLGQSPFASTLPWYGGSCNGQIMSGVRTSVVSKRVVVADAPLYPHFLQKSSPARLPWQKKAMFDMCEP